MDFFNEERSIDRKPLLSGGEPASLRSQFPKSLKYGSSGLNIADRQTGATFRLTSGLENAHVPFRSASPCSFPAARPHYTQLTERAPPGRDSESSA